MERSLSRFGLKRGMASLYTVISNVPRKFFSKEKLSTPWHARAVEWNKWFKRYRSNEGVAVDVAAIF